MKYKKAIRFVVGLLFIAMSMVVIQGCKDKENTEQEEQVSEPTIADRVAAFAPVRLEADLSSLSEKERAMLPLLFEVATIMDDIFWYEAYGERDALFSSLEDSALALFAQIHYGPWDRLSNNHSFVPGVGTKPEGANFYPTDMTKDEFAAIEDPTKESMYTLIRRDETGKLCVIPYHEAFASQIERAAELLDSASLLAEDEGLKRYLSLRADALRTDDYQASDMAWMDMRTNRIDFVVGPIENYEDHLFGTKAAHEAFILLKDMEWSAKLAHYNALLPSLQEGLPVEPEYKKEKPGSESDLGVYDVIYYAGDCNAGSKTIAINLPNDPEVHLQKGSRKLQLKNAIQYKFDLIMQPIAGLLIDSSQLHHVTARAFFENTLFHEIAHGLGIKNTLDGTRTTREALLETYSAIEEGKADILGIYMIEQLIERGELTDVDIMDYYVTFMAGIFRSIRFGAASAHGVANTVRFHYFQEKGAFTCDSVSGRYRVDREKMAEAVKMLSREILTIQGDGNYAAAKQMVDQMGVVSAPLQESLDRIMDANIPIDLRYEQGMQVLGLQ